MQEVTNFFQLDAPDIIKMMRAADTNGDGQIDYTEFLTAAFQKQTLLQEENLKKAFGIFDSNGDGHISLDELKSGFGGVDLHSNSGQESSEELWKNILAEADANGDGQISYLEFKNHMQNVIDKRATFSIPISRQTTGNNNR